MKPHVRPLGRFGSAVVHAWTIGGTAALLLAVGCAARGAAGPAAPRAAATRPAGGADDSVSVGYGQQRRRDLTSAVGSATREDWDGQNAQTVGDYLRGRIAGLDVQQGGDGLLTLRVRGASSIYGSTEPLLVIDGVPVAGPVGPALASLAPRDVARVDVLKDAAAAAVYGSRGANGVVLLTTRRR